MIKFAAIAALMIATLFPQAQARDCKAILIAGQSNAIGAENTTYRQVAADTFVELYDEIGQSDPHAKDLTKIELPTGNNPAAPRWLQAVDRNPIPLAPVFYTTKMRSGAEITLGRLLYQHDRTQCWTVLKYAFGGTGLNRDWFSQKSVGLADQMLVFLSEITGHYESNSDTITLIGAIWVQGASDTSSSIDADAYGKRLKQLVFKVRSFTNNPKLPFAIARTSIDLSKLSEEQQKLRAGPLSKVRAAQLRFTQSDSCAGLINLDDLQHTDAFHFTSRSYDTIGRRAYVVIMARVASCL